MDSLASITTGWPTLLDYDNITTHLPASEEAFDKGHEEVTTTLVDVFSGGSQSTFTGSIVVCHIFNRMAKHVRQIKAHDHPENYLHGEYWKRHRELDNTLMAALASLPERYQLPKYASNPVAVQKNLDLHASVISLHIDACQMADTHNLPDHIKRASLKRLQATANAIVHIMRMTSHYNGLVCANSHLLRWEKIQPHPVLSFNELQRSTDLLFSSHGNSVALSSRYP